MEADKINNIMNCPICNKDVYSDLGKSCLMCGMVIKGTLDFCSNKCKIKYKKINK